MACCDIINHATLLLGIYFLTRLGEFSQIEMFNLKL